MTHTMDLNWSPADLAFRDEVRAFLDAELTPELRATSEKMTSVYAKPEVSLDWQRRLHKRGWLVPSWPVEHGGTGWSVVQRYIFTRELAEAGAPPLSPMGLGMIGPVLLHYGTPEQKATLLPRMFSGEDFWCQGYSEPESGSDLASLRMKAVRDGDHFICTGTKIWTTHAHYANRMFCLVRTADIGKPQLGITFLLIDMDAPGVTVRPIVSLSGEHIQNQVMFDNVRVPVSNVIGAIDDGWTVAKYLMEFERGGSQYAPGLRTRLARLRRFLRSGEAGETGVGLRHAITDVEQQIDAMDAQELQFMALLSRGGTPGMMASVLKIQGTELSQRLTEIELEASGVYGAAFQPQLTAPGGEVPGFVAPAGNSGVGPAYAAKAAPKYFNDRAGSIYAGTNEIQRNIIYKLLATA
ncbi:MAG TPA: acyl-CoA dehydrogenase family protein [Polymorphobacter sp.]|nr:acyl-CoA dehydrogenase family protein [Polymorphobacter sp.]